MYVRLLASHYPAEAVNPLDLKANVRRGNITLEIRKRINPMNSTDVSGPIALVVILHAFFL